MHKVKMICPVCEEYEFEESSDYDICDICGWENDGLQNDDPDYWGGANSLSVNESKKVYSLLNQNDKKQRMLDILVEYKRREKEIKLKYRHIDYTTSIGDECRESFISSHNKFILDLNELL
jgi:hypothetical protein